MQVTSTGIAVGLAVVVALGLLFFGAKVFSPFQSHTSATATTTSQSASTTSMDTSDTSGAAPASAAASIPNPLPTQLTASDTVIGTGATAASGDTVTVNYVGMLPDGTVFDASANHGQAFSFQLGGGQVIKGWDEGVVGMKVGGKRRLIIPPSDGYGSQANGPIPANSTLIFDIELVSVTPPTQ